MARSGATTRSRSNSRKRYVDNSGLIPVLARTVRQVEAAAQRGKVSPSGRTRFLVVAILMREERARVKADTEVSDGDRAEQLKRLDGIASILAQTASRDTSLIALLESESLPASAQKLRRDLLLEAGMELSLDEQIVTEEKPAAAVAEVNERQVVPVSVRQRALANPFLAPDFDAVAPKPVVGGRLGNWELLGPLFRSFEHGSGSNAASMALPEPGAATALRGGLELMPHQAELVESAREGHRTFLLADEPGLGKTAQSLLAANAAKAFPLLVVVPNVVKVNWAREVQRWVPNRSATVVQGDGDDLDAFADVIIVNYEVLDRHVGWLRNHGFQGMVVDEAHFIKNLSSQRSKHVLELSRSIRARKPNALLMALTGTPLINDIDDFRAIWQMLGWIDDKKPLPQLMRELEGTGLTPAEPGFFAAARQAVIDQGIVRRRKEDVASDLPSRRIADLPVELDDSAGRSIRAAERELGQRLLDRFKRARKARQESRVDAAPISDDELMRMVAQWELEESKSAGDGDNVFTMLRTIGKAKAGLAADYTAQLARSAGKVVFFAKHIDVMDTAEATFEREGLRSISIRGDQTPTQRQAAIDAFVNDPEVAVAVCSLTAAGVGLNLQVASNVVLAELSWTSAEQTQAIDRVHRIGQEQPVIAWRIIAAQTIDSRIAELIDSKAGLAARALDGDDSEIVDATSLQVDALVHLLKQALHRR